MSEPRTKVDAAWDRLVDLMMDYAEHRLPDGETAVRRGTAQALIQQERPAIEAAIEAEARSGLDVERLARALLSERIAAEYVRLATEEPR